MYNSKITGLGFYVPDNIVTNDDLAKLMDKPVMLRFVMKDADLYSMKFK